LVSQSPIVLPQRRELARLAVHGCIVHVLFFYGNQQTGGMKSLEPAEYLFMCAIRLTLVMDVFRIMLVALEAWVQLELIIGGGKVFRQEPEFRQINSWPAISQ